uniref:Uncharacterized protein n=1 Tax=Oryza sativa subsp. japonica TaxID=39947 RepID=Q6YSZ7_ORYSJ|nr:hypothetical protein [Oryza sativa Japonica Group]BAD10749.1 hypothetical protein [Oryza sativa Japonica Group]
MSTKVAYFQPPTLAIEQLMQTVCRTFFLVRSAEEAQKGYLWRKNIAIVAVVE